MQQLTEEEIKRIGWVLDSLKFINSEMDRLENPFPIWYGFESGKYYKLSDPSYMKGQTGVEFHPHYHEFGEYPSMYQMIVNKEAEFPYGASILWGYSHVIDDVYTYYRLLHDRIDKVTVSRYGNHVDEVVTIIKFDDQLLEWIRNGLYTDLCPYDSLGYKLAITSQLSVFAQGVFLDAIPHLKKVKADVSKCVSGEEIE